MKILASYTKRRLRSSCQLDEQHKPRIPWLLTACLFGLLLGGCATARPSEDETQAALTALAASQSAALPVSPTSTPTLQPVSSPTVQPTASETATLLSPVCSPLHGFQIDQLTDIVAKPYNPPAPGGEGGHHGVDFSFYSYGAFTSMERIPVQAVLEGVVAAVIADRPPYGNLVIIETPISSLPLAWQESLAALPQPAETHPDNRLFCPTPVAGGRFSQPESLYLLYAHLADKPDLALGDHLGCGQQIGLVGNTGYSGNTHLHLEMRQGPSGVQFLHLAHYINNASDEEMAGYCAWRISSQFLLLDPLALLLIEP